MPIRAIYPEEGERLVAEWAKRGVRMVTAQEIVKRERPRDCALTRRVIATHSVPFSPTLYLATVRVRADGELRDVRTSPESPAPWPDELSSPVLSLFSPFTSPFFFYLAGNGPNRPFHPPFERVTHPTAVRVTRSLLATSCSFACRHRLNCP